ncbi:hypothetical protein [Microbacterium sp. ProA8]|jgi:hypothetical protein|uniref:phage tail tube protein n=1 Tax=Microbacterium chionoecetis TaxID=3153754 RepID=UPI003262CD94
MADVADVVPAAIDVKGNLVIWWVGGAMASLTAPSKVSVFDAATTFRVTHSFTPGGFALDADQVIDTDSRLGLTVDLEALGIRTDTLGMLEYVDATEASSAAVVLKPVGSATSISGYFVVRRNVTNTTVATAAQKVYTIPVTLGTQIFPVTPDGKALIKQRASITGPIVHGVIAA